MMGGKMMRGKMFRPSGDDDDSNDNLGDSSSDSSDDDDSDEDVAKTSAAAPAAAPPAAASKPSANLSSDDDDDEEEEEDANKPSKRSRDEDSDEDEDDEEEEEEEQPSSKKSKKESNTKGKKKKKQSKISFFDEEAEASDDDDDDDDDIPYGTHKDPDDIVRKHYTEEDIRKEYRDEEAEAIIAQQDRRRQRAGGWLGGMDGAEDEDYRDAARIARELEERHRMERRIVNRDRMDAGRRRGGGLAREDRDMEREEDEDEEMVAGPAYTAVSQQSLVPSVSDPSLWMFSCPTGKEQELVYQIMNKCVAFAKRGRPLGITSVVTAQTRGKIYIESYSEPAVMEAVQGVRGLMQYSKTLIPIADMTTVMTVVPKKVPGEFIDILFNLLIHCWNSAQNAFFIHH